MGGVGSQSWASFDGSIVLVSLSPDSLLESSCSDLERTLLARLFGKLFFSLVIPRLLGPLEAELGVIRGGMLMMMKGYHFLIEIGSTILGSRKGQFVQLKKVRSSS